jgi:hypothetical protein
MEKNMEGDRGIPEFLAKREFLMKMIERGHMEETFDILGNRVKLRTLDDGEETEALKETSGFDFSVKSKLIPQSMLCRALVSVNGDFVPNDVEARIFIKKLPPLIVEQFWKEFEALRAKRDLYINEAMLELKKSSRSPSQGDTGGGSEPSSQDGSAPSIL